MLTQICQYLRKWFVRDKYFGTFKIENGVLTYADGTALSLLNGQYFRIVGSILNDGVFQYQTPAPANAASELQDEVFNGAVWSMAIPRDFLALVSEISAWCSTYSEAITSPYASQTVGDWTRTLKGGSGAGTITWQTQFDAQLSPWRKI